MRIRTKIGILSLVPSIVVGSLASWLFFYNARQDLEKEIFAKLEAVTRLKVDSLETFFAENKADLADMGAVYKLIQDKTGMGDSGETLLVKKISADKALFLTPLLHDPDALLKKEIIFGSGTALPAQKAAMGGRGCGVELDYRDIDVLSCWSYIPLAGWGMVAKVDKAEAFASIARLQKVVVAIFVIGVSSVLLVVLVASRGITGPILKLHAGTEIIGKGDWNHKVGQAGKDEIGQLSRAFDSMMQNLKETSASRDELNREVEFSKGLLKTIPYGMDIVDENGNILFINDKLRAQVGGAMEGKKCWELYRDDKERCKDCPLAKEIQLGETATIETHGCLGGRMLQISHTGMMYQGKLAVMEIFQDITERIMAQEEARKAVNIKSEFISVVSHELRAPLGPIKEGASLMLEGLAGEINAKQRDLLEMIKRSAERLVRLINSVLDFQKLESGKVKFTPGPNSINDVIQEVYQTMAISVKGKGLGFMLDTAKDIPLVLCDRDKIVQILTHLVSNAIKCTEQGHIKIMAAREDGVVHVTVIDTGFGIKKEDIPKLFISFQQLDTVREKKLGGTGLGLAISKEIILQHKGKIWVESEFGKGSSFHFILPIESPQSQSPVS